MDTLGGSLQNWAILGSFLKVKLQNGNYFGGCENFNIFGRMPDILDIFGGKL